MVIWLTTDDYFEYNSTINCSLTIGAISSREGTCRISPLKFSRLTDTQAGRPRLSAASMKRAAEAMFGGDLSGLDERTLLEIFHDVPSTALPKDLLGAGRTLLDVLA